MTIDIVVQVLAWCALINYAVLVLWFLFVVAVPGLVYKLHSRLFKLSEQAFYTTHYAGIGLYKLLIFIFLLVPYLVLRFIVS